MIEHIQRSARIACASVVLLLAACGGGGGGGGGTDLSSAPGLALSPTSLSFTAVQNGALPSTQNVQVTITSPAALGIIVGFPTGVTPPVWFDQNSSFFCTPSLTFCTLVAAISTTSLAPGTYTTTLRFVIGDTPQHALALRDLPISYTITPPAIATIPSSLDFSFITGGTPPAAQPILLTGGTGSWTASANQPWISVPSSGSGGLVNIGVNPTGLTPSTYNGTVTFSSGGHTAPVTVSLTVAAPGIQTSQASLSFSGINGATIASKALAITMSNGAALSWTASTPLPDTWLVLGGTSGMQTDALSVSVNPALLASGVYNSSITLQGTSGGSPFNKTVNVTLTLTKATLTPSPVSVTLGGTNGRDFSGVPVQLSLNTGANSFSWNSTASSFIQRSPSSGSVSATPVSLMLTPNATGLTGGTHSGSVTFATQVNGDTVSVNVPVTFNLESHKLLVDGNGVAFSSMPSLSSLTRTLRVRDNLGLATPWSASSDQTWLTVTSGGTADGTSAADLVLTANPAGLIPNSVNLATVSITSSDTTVENNETIRVGLWVGSTTPTATTTISTAYNEIAADPIRPYAYVAGAGGDIQVYNVYTGLLVTTIPGVATQVGILAISQDGSTLYAVDTSNLTIVPVNLDTYVAGTAWPLSGSPTYPRIVYGRTNGFGFVLAGDGRAYDATSGAVLAPTFFGAVSELAVARNGTLFCAETTCRTLDYTALRGGELSIGDLRSLHATDFPDNCHDVAISNDASRIYLACGAVYHFMVFDGTTLNQISSLPGDAYPNIIEVTADGRVFTGAFFGPVANDVWIYDSTGALLATYQIAGLLLDRQLKVSGDGIRMMTLSDAPALTFTTVGP
jgi:hypothetical protein